MMSNHLLRIAGIFQRSVLMRLIDISTQFQLARLELTMVGDGIVEGVIWFLESVSGAD
jgi:hypothetical protein